MGNEEIGRRVTQPARAGIIPARWPLGTRPALTWKRDIHSSTDLKSITTTSETAMGPSTKWIPCVLIQNVLEFSAWHFLFSKMVLAGRGLILGSHFYGGNSNPEFLQNISLQLKKRRRKKKKNPKHEHVGYLNLNLNLILNLYVLIPQT